MGDKLYIVIPAYNEEKTIGKVLNSLKKAGYKNVVVVDDGSQDKTPVIVRKLNVPLLRHIINRGQGAALKTGIEYALLKEADIIVTFDADGQFLVKEIRKVVEPITNKDAEAVLGSRFLGEARNIPFSKKIVLSIGKIVVRILYGIKVTDSQIGFRAFSRKAAETIDIKSNRMEHAGEIMGEIVRNSLRYKEVPVTIIYTSYSKKRGQSWKDSLKLGIKMLLRRMMR
ncbi:glycosyltransferase family 2 protein [Candidatus Woesearchaeota archaeon]|nr:glycosyltransferase family 2 protein [Candidatus Woesearchaeota archaeon]